MMLVLLGTGVVAADEFPLSNKRPLPAGDGWRVLYADFPASFELAYRVAFATDRASYAVVWAMASGSSGPAPIVAFDSQVIALFATGANSCTAAVSFDRVVFDAERRLVHAEISETRTCMLLDLTSSAVFVVALARDRLPVAPFTLQLGSERLCHDCPDAITVDF